MQTGSSLLTVRCKRFFCQFKRFRVGTGFELDTVRFFFGSVFFQFGLLTGSVLIRFNIIRVDSVSGLLKYGSGRFSVSKKSVFNRFGSHLGRSVSGSYGFGLKFDSTNHHQYVTEIIKIDVATFIVWMTQV